jgi:hypothetical protein
LDVTIAEARPVEEARRGKLSAMKAQWQGRIGQTAAKYGENAPMAATCCNACRVCVQTNLLALGLAAVIGASAGMTKFVKKLRPSA